MFVATGCGTTVSGAGAVAAPAGADGLTAPTTSTGSGGAAGSAPLPGTAAGGGGSAAGAINSGTGSTGSSGVGGSPGVAPGGSTAPGPAGLPTKGRGYDATHVYVGFPTNTDVSDAAPKGLGATDFGDQVAQINAVVADVNRHGGLLGRKVVPLFHDMRTASLQVDPQSQAQGACTAFTDDHTVVAVVNIVAAIDLPTFYACLAKHDTPVMSAGFVPVDDTLLRSYAPYLYKLTTASFTELTPVWLDRLTAMGYFHGWNPTTGSASATDATIGLLYPDVQPQQRIFADIEARLEAHGYTTKTFEYDVSSLDAESASMASAVLQFRNSGVTHVLSSESDVLLFMSAADGQHYRPRYGLTSYHAPAVQLQGTVPTSQLVGSMGTGWLPVSDVDAAHNPGPVSRGETACRHLMTAAHQNLSSASAAIVAFALCDGVHLVVDGVRATGNPTSAGLHAGLASIAPQFAPALVWHAALSGSRADMPGQVRDFRFDGSAFRYVSTTRYRL